MNAAVSKTVGRVTPVSGVRIPPSPPHDPTRRPVSAETGLRARKPPSRALGAGHSFSHLSERRTASAQRAATDHISRSHAQPGDLVFFHNSSGHVYHVGIYAGHNKVLHSPHSGSHVKTETIWTSHVSFGRP